MTTPQLLVHLSDPADIILGTVNSSWCKRVIKIWMDRTLVDPRLVVALQSAGQQALPTLLHMIVPGRTPIVRYFLERDIPGGQLVHVELTPYQNDVYVKRGLMPQAVADELAGHSTAILRSYPWTEDDAWRNP